MVDPLQMYYSSITKALQKSIVNSTGRDKDILLTNFEILQDMPYEQRVEVLKLFKMLSGIYGMSDVLAWEAVCKIARKTASQI